MVVTIGRVVINRVRGDGMPIGIAWIEEVRIHIRTAIPRVRKDCD